jgi:hypothetical protein
MDYFATGLDVSVKETSVCIVDDAGKIVREARVASEPETRRGARLLRCGISTQLMTASGQSRRTNAAKASPDVRCPPIATKPK